MSQAIYAVMKVSQAIYAMIKVSQAIYAVMKVSQAMYAVMKVSHAIYAVICNHNIENIVWSKSHQYRIEAGNNSATWISQAPMTPPEKTGLEMAF